MPNKSLLKIALLVSVVLNLFLVGVLAGNMPQKQRYWFGPMSLASPHGEYMAGWIERHLSPEDAALFNDVFLSQSETLKQAHERVHEAAKNTAAAFEQEPRDSAALQAALDSLGQAKTELGKFVGTIVMLSFDKLSSDGRHRFAELTR